MGLISFSRKNSFINKVCSVALSLVMIANLMFGYVALTDGGSEEVKAAATTDKAPYRNVMYYGEWSIYSGQNNFYPSKIDGSLITHLNFAFLDVDSNGDLVLCDEHADFLAVLPEQSGLTYGDPYAGVCGALSILRAKYPNMKIGISVGGWTRSGDFSGVAADPVKRQNFAKNISKFVDYLGYDFVDIDWEYPTAVRASDAEGNGVTIDEGCPGKPEDTQNFTLLLQSIRDELDKLGTQNNKYYELSVAMSASPAMMAKIEYDKVLNIVDFANMMTYDLNGAWNAYTGHQTALYTNEAYNHETQLDGQFSIDACVSYLEQTYGNKIDYSKIVIGVAPYTRGWAGVKNDGPDSDNPGLYATATPNSVKAPDGTTSGTYAYGDIDSLIKQYNLTEYYDEKAQAAYYYSKETGYFFTCDNERSVAAKGQYVKNKKLGGLISWMASLDSSNSLTKVMHDSLYGNSVLPAQEIKTANPNASVEISASGSQYTITLKNNERADETNTALKDAEAFKETLTYPKLYIKSKSGATFSAGSESGSVTNQDGYGVVDLASVYAGKSIKQGGSHTFTVNVSGTADVSDIESITMTRRILTSLDEFGEQIVYGNGSGSGEIPIVTAAPTTKADDSSETPTQNGGTQPSQGTGSYEQWSVGKNYNAGDIVAYQGKVYECIRAIPGQEGWDPVSLLGEYWKERTDLVNTSTAGNEENSGGSSSDNNYTVNGTLPQHMVTGYWHNFVNGSANLKLRDVPTYYDMICVAFTGNTATPGQVTFEIDPDLSKALGGYSKAEFIQDIKDLKAKGQHVIISVGGAEGRIEINSNASADLFAQGLINIISEYGFEGVDIDLEGSAVSGVDYIAEALRKVHDHFGDDFIITMAPETYYIQANRLSSNDITTSYLRLALKIKDILTICYPQFYNSGGMNGYGGTIVNPGTADFLTSLSTLVIEAGLRADQVAIGVPSMEKAASSGYVSPDIVKTALNSMIYGTSSGSFTPPKAYPTFRGVMTWSINWDATNGYAWAKAMSEAVDKLPTTEPSTTKKPDVQPTKPVDQPTEPQTTTKNPSSGDDTGFNPANLTYTTIECSGTPELKLEYAVPSTTIDGVAPWYGDGGNTLSIQFSAAAGLVSEVTVNGQAAADGVVKETAMGLVKIDPTKLANNTYTVIKVNTENGKLTFVVKKGTPSVVEPEPPTEPETSGDTETTPDIVISGDVDVEGYQISSALGGSRVVGSVEPVINNKKVSKWGFIYAITQTDLTTYPVTDEDMYVGADNAYVASLESTPIGTIDVVMGESKTATYFVRTTLFTASTAKEFNARYKVRAYALLEDGSYVYSKIYSYSVYDICDTLYQNKMSNTNLVHDYLYNNILKVVNPNYKEVDYDWPNMVVKPLN